MHYIWCDKLTHVWLVWKNVALCASLYYQLLTLCMGSGVVGGLFVIPTTLIISAYQTVAAIAFSYFLPFSFTPVPFFWCIPDFPFTFTAVSLMGYVLLHKNQRQILFIINKFNNRKGTACGWGVQTSTLLTSSRIQTFSLVTVECTPLCLSISRQCSLLFIYLF